MQKRRRRVLILIGVGVSIGVLVFVFRPAPEPEYRGKKLSEWVGGYGSIPEFTGSPRWVIPSETDLAIQHIGTKAVPYLLTWIGYETPAWKVKLYAAAKPIMRRLNFSWNLRDEKDVRLARGAINGLIALGPEADGAMAELTQLVNKPRGKASAARAAIALGGLGHPVESASPYLIDAILKEMYDVGIERNRTNSHAVAIFKFKQTNTIVRQVGSNTLRKIEPQRLETNAP
jgi:hypothetical protein